MTPYDPLAVAYRLLIDPFLAPMRRSVGEMLRQALPPARRRVLDVACGTGDQLLRLAGSGHCRVGLDLSEGMLRRSRRRVDDDLHVVRGDAGRLPFRTGMFDAGMIQLGLHELGARLRRAVGAELLRVTGRDAVYLFLDFSPADPHSRAGRTLAAVERAAGREHYRNGRAFIRQGGITAFVERLGLRIERSKPFFQGHIRLVLARRNKEG